MRRGIIGIICLLLTSLHAYTELIAIVSTNASASIDTSVYYCLPVDGRLLIRISNPDISADGMFIVEVRDSVTDNCIAYNEFCTTGIVPFGSRFYHSNPTDGLAYPEYEMSFTSGSSPIPPAPGTPRRGGPVREDKESQNSRREMGRRGRREGRFRREPLRLHARRRRLHKTLPDCRGG